jgi:hypothetical protein
MLSEAFFGVELGARVTRRGWDRPALINVGEVAHCRSRAEAEHLGRLLTGRNVRYLMDHVAGFYNAEDVEQDGDVVTSFSVYFYDGEQTTDLWDYDENGRIVP